MELDSVEDGNLTLNVKEVKNKSRRGSVLFNIPATNSFGAKVTNEIPHTEYKKKMEDERKEWINLIKDQKRINSNEENKPFKLDESMLTESQKVFMRAAPDFAKFQAESKQFCRDAEYFLRVKSDFQMKTKSIAPLFKDRLEEKNVEIAVHSNLLQLPPPLDLN